MSAAQTPVFAIEALETNKTVNLLVGGELFDAPRIKSASGGLELQAALARARAKHGHALCWCKKPGLKLQIRRIEGKLHLALWPGEGQEHESNCAFHRELIQTIKPHDLLQAAAEHQPITAKPREESRRGDLPAMRDLSTMLWVQASLNRWHPKWERDWGRTRFELLKAAQNIHHHGRTLADITFIPKPYRPSEKHALNAQWDMFLRGLVLNAKEGGKTNCIIIAPLKRISVNAEGVASLHLSHLNSPIGLDDQAHTYMRNSFRVAYSRAKDAPGHAEALTQARTEPANKLPGTVAVLQCRMSSKGGLWAVQSWLLSVHPERYIPCVNTNEVALCETLVRNGYEFTKLIHNEPPSRRVEPDWLLHNVIGPDGLPVHNISLSIEPTDIDPAVMRTKQTIEQNLLRSGMATWKWAPRVDDKGAIVQPELPGKAGARPRQTQSK